jgi:hypothetical protein
MNLNEVVKAISTTLLEANKAETRELEKFLDKEKLTKLITAFASDLSQLYGVEDNDQGPFDSNFCGRLEETIKKRLRDEIKIAVSKRII